jgi:hypothetical protein
VNKNQKEREEGKEEIRVEDEKIWEEKRQDKCVCMCQLTQGREE